MYETAKSRTWKKTFQEDLKREIRLQHFDPKLTGVGHWYVDCLFTLTRTNQDCNNFFKILLDTMTGVATIDDKNLLPRVYRVNYDKEHPRTQIVLHKVKWIGCFDNQQKLDEFESKCKDCRFYRKGGCKILSKLKTGELDANYQDNKCKKYIRKKVK